MNLTDIAGLALVLICVGLMIAFSVANRSRPYRGLRVIPAFGRLRRAISLAVEDGSRVHVTLGSANVTGANAASALVGLTVLERVAQSSSTSDRPPVASSGDATMTILSQDTLKSVYQAANVPDEYQASQGRLTGLTPFSYAAGAMPIFHDEQVSANVMYGNFGPEAALLADAADQNHTFLMAGSDSLPAQAVLFAAAQEPLIGEEVFAGGAYLQAGGMHPASLHAQDVIRWAIIVLMAAGSVLKLLGIL